MYHGKILSKSHDHNTIRNRILFKQTNQTPCNKEESSHSEQSSEPTAGSLLQYPMVLNTLTCEAVFGIWKSDPEPILMNNKLDNISTISCHF